MSNPIQKLLNNNLLLLVVVLLVLLCSERVTSFSPATPTTISKENSRYSTGLHSTSSSVNNGIRFLGKGPNAIVRPGVVLVAPKDEFHHFYRQSAIFVYAMGEDEDMDNEYVIRGAIIDHPTPFTLGETTDESAGVAKNNPLADNFIFRGGDKGDEIILMLHNQESIGKGNMIGTSGIYEGGIMEALEAGAKEDVDPLSFKFFFGFVQFTENELEQMLDDSPWLSVEVPPDYVLDIDLDRGDCWRRLRNALHTERGDDDE